MKATKFFLNSADMADFAKDFRKENPQRKWYFRTSLQCNHRIDEKRKAIVLTDNETITQRLVTCKICFNAQNSAS